MLPSDPFPAHTPMMHHGKGRASVFFPGHLRSTYTGTYTALSTQNRRSIFVWRAHSVLHSALAPAPVTFDHYGWRSIVTVYFISRWARDREIAAHKGTTSPTLSIHAPPHPGSVSRRPGD